MPDLRDYFFQRKNIDFVKKTLGKELWIQVSGNRNMDASSAVFWAALMPVENIDEAYRDCSWNSHIGTQCPGFIEYGDKITYEANPLSFDSCLNIVHYRDFYGIKPSYVEISEEFRLLNNLYHDTNTNIFYEIENNGECAEVAKITNEDCVYIKLKSLMRYAAAKQMALLLFLIFGLRFLARCWRVIFYFFCQEKNICLMLVIASYEKKCLWIIVALSKQSILKFCTSLV